MADGHLRRVTTEIEGECLALRLDDAQTRFIATNAQSPAQARAHPALVPLAVYDRAACGYLRPGVPMIGFVPWELDDSVRKPGEVYLRLPNGERR